MIKELFILCSLELETDTYLTYTRFLRVVQYDSHVDVQGSNAKIKRIPSLRGQVLPRLD